MKLESALDQVHKLQDDDVIFAKKPWMLDSEAEIGSLDSDLCVPKEITDRGLAYFLDANVAREVLEVFGDREPTLDESRALLLYYAEHDAYPDWVYKKPTTMG